jgi:hypothetical protein
MGHKQGMRIFYSIYAQDNLTRRWENARAANRQIATTREPGRVRRPPREAARMNALIIRAAAMTGRKLAKDRCATDDRPAAILHAHRYPRGADEEP